jgi:hypothetical protein
VPEGGTWGVTLFDAADEPEGPPAFVALEVNV